MRYPRHRLSEKGFTIIELMIATAVLSTILLLATVIMISIGNLYYKGVNQARVQDDVHGIVDEIAQRLQLSGTSAPILVQSTPSGKISAYCIGDTRYVFVTGQKIGSGLDRDGTTPLSPHVLWRDQAPAGCAAPSDNFLSTVTVASDPSGTELIAPNSRLTRFCITGAGSPTCTPSPSPYSISVGVAYGDIDLLNNPASINATCKGNIGDQFCATSSLTTAVAQRLTP